MPAESHIASTAAGLVSQVGARRVDPVAITSATLARIAGDSRALAAFRHVRHDEALAEVAVLAERSDLGELALARVPIAVKEVAAIAGEYPAWESPSTAQPFGFDSDVVERLRAAGEPRMPLHYVDPHNEHGRRHRAVERFGRSRPGQFASRHVFLRIDPWLHRATAGRYPQSTRLTEAGEVFLPRAKALVRTAAQATAQARDAAQPSRITIGYTTSLIITPVVRVLRHDHPDADVEVLHLNWNQPRDALLDHRVDAVVAEMPFSTDQLHVTLLYDEPRVVLVPVDHRLAGRQSVTVDDIADEPIPKLRDCDPAWNDFWRIDPRPDGRAAPDGPLFGTLDDGLELIAAGQAVAITTCFYERLRPDLTSVPLEDVEPSHVVVASRAGDRNRLVAAFRKLAAAHLTAPARN